MPDTGISRTHDGLRRLRDVIVIAAILFAVACGAIFLRADAHGPAVAVAQGTPASAGTPIPAGTPVSPGTPASPCDATMPGDDGETWVRTELYFGAPPTQEDWQDFLDTEVTPRFPDGLTVLQGYGQWRSPDGTIGSEESIVLILFYPYDETGQTSQQIDEIREAYKARFDQQSVLRVDDASAACVSF